MQVNGMARQKSVGTKNQERHKGKGGNRKEEPIDLIF